MVANDAEPKKKGGRPRKHPFGTRVRAGMRDQLEAEAKARNLSMSEEIERRLSFSFEMAASAEDEFMLRAFSQALKYSKTIMGRSWVNDPLGAQLTYDAIKVSSSLMIHGRGLLDHPEHIEAIANGVDLDVVMQKAKDKAALEMRGAGAAIGAQVTQLFFGRSMQEIENLGREHIQKAKAFAERWHEEVENPAAGLGTAPEWHSNSPKADLDKPTAAPTKRSRKTKTPS